MKYIDEFRDGELAKGLAEVIAREANPARSYHFMEFCGGHTHAISRYGVSDLLPANVRMIHGPGCPVCVPCSNCSICRPVWRRKPARGTPSQWSSCKKRSAPWYRVY